MSCPSHIYADINVIFVRSKVQCSLSLGIIIVILSQLYSYAFFFSFIICFTDFIVFIILGINGLCIASCASFVSLVSAFMVTGECPGTNHKWPFFNNKKSQKVKLKSLVKFDRVTRVLWTQSHLLTYDEITTPNVYMGLPLLFVKINIIIIW